MHVPVLLHEVIEKLDPYGGEFVIDGTLGAGGHAKAFIERVSPGGKFLGIDWDRGAVERARRNLSAGGLEKFVIREGNYADLPEILAEENLGKADILFLDLGFSSDQLDNGRGFSFQKNEPLIMTYNDEETPAYSAIRQLKKRELAEVIRTFSDERYAERIATAIYERGKKDPIKTTGELADVIKAAVPKNYEMGRINPATRTFQAIRMYINEELTNLETVLKDVKKIVGSGGRVGIISFHSKEDRIVKNYFRDMAHSGEAELITKKPLQASEEEIRNNPKSRSAKLRVLKIK
ncbi:MAG: Ribosomal RNA small subunit methyltransferase H [Parcubacteria group bacterium GW2011_GWB1_45_7]|uniref:Ribosomal RNA small subunit methyltransferase H n=2 Tax=Parcubacteria group TaxID=1794811 RepID=A0A0H4T7K3_9BACT|nr:S-adenosyl-methyltransferase MraW, 16S rRNA (cytosine1402-N4)-methyltransferase [uncultured Parcubacteria bacterium Rifle_16ft_4_minimus_37647]KKU11273.1 MAG: Ribosomal RNA small subunit methyltransferase H [Parcubacteria group bacterium GW2011_GWB1_45_7]OGY62599.1 MAG: 16S rRNA (cytosine(1402)-N(4))-methyltransferase [Candidatus Colwellbacteria bacterium RIFCSPLOWO2_12_FULL_46_17]